MSLNSLAMKKNLLPLCFACFITLAYVYTLMFDYRHNEYTMYQQYLSFAEFEHMDKRDARDSRYQDVLTEIISKMIKNVTYRVTI